MRSRVLAGAVLTTTLLLGGCGSHGEISLSPEQRGTSTTTNPESFPSGNTHLTDVFDARLQEDAADGHITLDIYPGACAGIQLHDSEGSYMALVAKPGYYEIHDPESDKDIGALVGQDPRTGDIVHSRPMTFDSDSRIPDDDPSNEDGDGGLIIPTAGDGLRRISETVNFDPALDITLPDGGPVMRMIAIDLTGNATSEEFLRSSLIIGQCVSQLDKGIESDGQIGGRIGN